ncbi:MAG TPA: aminodeoxychorismate/anthranilate synthase component II [Candidatus Saccharimonadia bacterium]|jgi:anthranilate synthase component 2|nr:aminodeoxychorismate/anthranilate synthase component II [Candidatus Saccharimonadia bacterium]
MKVLIIDNFDSFTYNLYQLVGKLLGDTGKHFQVDVFRNNEITVKEIVAAGYDRIIISPGPGSPDDPAYFGVCADVIREVGKTVPVLGVCLGMQGMASGFGGRVVRARVPMHGKTSQITHDGQGVFAGLPQGIEVMRYHSLVAEPASLPDEFVVTARTGDDDQAIMGLRHKIYPIEGIQFHPESFASEGGERMVQNFLEGAH